MNQQQMPLRVCPSLPDPTLMPMPNPNSHSNFDGLKDMVVAAENEKKGADLKALSSLEWMISIQDKMYSSSRTSTTVSQSTCLQPNAKPETMIHTAPIMPVHPNIAPNAHETVSKGRRN